MDDNRAAAVAGRKTVVVVEDDPEIRELETFLLTAEGYQVIGTADGTEGLAAIQRCGADLVVLDLMLPDKSGNEILQEIGQSQATANIPVVVVSAFTGALAVTPQVKHVLRKPFDVTELLESVAHELDDAPRD